MISGACRGDAGQKLLASDAAVVRTPNSELITP